MGLWSKFILKNMKSLNDYYNSSCKPAHNNYYKLINNTFLIDNFFEDFKSAKKFLFDLQKWKSTSFQIHSKSGWESLLPSWVGRYLLQKFVHCNKISDDLFSYSAIVDYRFNNSNEDVWNLSHSTYFPHYDSISDDYVQFICLVNLNEVPVCTNFYTYKNNNFCNEELRESWIKYDFEMNEKLKELYKNQKISTDKVKNFLYLNPEDMKHKFSYSLTYNPNQAIVYQSNMLHSPNVPKNFNIQKPRALLRISFLCKRTNDDFVISYY